MSQHHHIILLWHKHATVSFTSWCDITFHHTTISARHVNISPHRHITIPGQLVRGEGLVSARACRQGPNPNSNWLTDEGGHREYSTLSVYLREYIRRYVSERWSQWVGWWVGECAMQYTALFSGNNNKSICNAVYEYVEINILFPINFWYCTIIVW